MPKNTADLEPSDKEDEPKKKRSRKKKPAEGSRWTALIMLVGTFLAGLCFYWMSGDSSLISWSSKNISTSETKQTSKDGFFVSTYVIEK